MIRRGGCRVLGTRPMPWWSSGSPRPPLLPRNGHKAGRKMAHLPDTAEEPMEDLKRHFTHPFMLLSMLTAASPSVPSSRRGMEASISLRPSPLLAAKLTWRPLTPSKHLPSHNFLGISCPGLPSTRIRGVKLLATPLAAQRVLATTPRNMLGRITFTASKYTTYVALSSSKWRVWDGNGERRDLTQWLGGTSPSPSSLFKPQRSLVN